MDGLSFLLDTNVVSEVMRPKPSASVLRRLERFRGHVGIAAVSWEELLFGLYRMDEGSKRLTLERYLFRTLRETMPILAFDAHCGQWLAKERERLTRNGRPPSYRDAQIAAIAAANQLTLVTRNIKDFTNFGSLEVADWFAG